jgi:hypothetical protein
MATRRNPWCPHQACDVYKAPEQLCRVCLEVYRAGERAVRQERERCVQAIKPLSLQSCGCYQEMMRLI